MMRLEIIDLSFNKCKPIGNIEKEIIQIINDKLIKIGVNARITYNNNIIYFKPVTELKSGYPTLFISLKKNKILMNKTDPRIKKLKRNHLMTDRITEKQEQFMWNNCINETLTSLGLLATIKLYENYDEDINSFMKLREGFNYKDWPLKQKVYPVGGDL